MARTAMRVHFLQDAYSYLRELPHGYDYVTDIRIRNKRIYGQNLIKA
jgi:hypothetical protein